MQITYYGQSCFQVNIGGYNILFDPYITPNPLAKEIDITKIEADYILLSHAHQDHIYDAEAIAKNTGATIIGIWEIHAWFEQKGVKTHPMNIGGKWPFEFGTVIMTPAIHSSSFQDGSYGGNPAGFVIENDEHTFYYSGDTALFSDMKLIGEMYKPEFAFLPIGDNFTMGIKEAVMASRFVGVKKIIGMHFDTFPYIQIDHKEAMMIASFNEAELILPEIGKPFEI
ncbi:MAG TPA: metal-dependent hydrolase [Catalimonadaceae bacterium]|nr:metal-dependent hydrolase [Catalimonadaceae bacterium]